MFSDSLSLDSSRLLTRVPIPKFSGDKKNYESLKAAFVSCVDRTNISPVYKLRRLHNCLECEACTMIESFSYSASAYNVAMERLERTNGGKRCQIALRLEELNNFRQMCDDNSRDLERFAE
jgi:hypothetical protein